MNVESFLEEELLALDSVHEKGWILEYLKKFNGIERVQKAQDVILRKKKREPLAYILGSWAFRSHEFCVGSGVLIPRPETEELVEYALAEFFKREQWKSKGSFKIVDLGAGSGCIGLSFIADLLSELKRRGVDAVDFSKCLELTLVEQSKEAVFYLEKNLQAFQQKILNCSVRVICGSWNAEMGDSYSWVLSNPPYLRESEYEEVDLSVKDFEPKSALLANGQEALSCYQEIIKICLTKMKRTGVLFFELGLEQDQVLSDWIKEFAPEFTVENIYKDLSGKNRVMHLEKK